MRSLTRTALIASAFAFVPTAAWADAAEPDCDGGLYLTSTRVGDYVRVTAVGDSRCAPTTSGELTLQPPRHSVSLPARDYCTGLASCRTEATITYVAPAGTTTCATAELTSRTLGVTETVNGSLCTRF